MNMDYERYYRETTSINFYGNGGVGKKDTLAKYDFNTEDADGRKVSEQMSKDETLQAMKTVSAQYGDNVIVEFSGDGLAKLVENRKDNLSFMDSNLSRDKRQAAFDGQVVQRENTHRMVIPNVQTNEKFYNSLSGVDEKVVGAANGIVKNYLLPNQIGDMSDAERKEMIAYGLEEARYLAENYLNDDQAKEFMSAMETIAKYGMNGTVTKDGTVTYSIASGLDSEGRVSDMDVLREKDPDLYKEINDLNMRIISHSDGEKYGDKFIELHKKAAKVLDAADKTKNSESQKRDIEEYRKWEQEIEKIELPVFFQNTKYTNLQAFFDGINTQSNLSSSWLNTNMERFIKWLNS